ncbi:MAG: nitroreductase family protein [Burkholderiales bacterium]|nr:nitroreductase family protein [Burkholderiales bacterium]
MNFLELSKKRFTAKEYNPNKKISDADFETLKQILRLSPSSVNSQPWIFLTGSTPEQKAKIRPAVADFNWPRLDTCSHFVLIAVHNGLDEKFLLKIIEAGKKDGRLKTEEEIKADNESRKYWVGLRDSLGETQTWEEKQAYIAMTVLLYAAASMGIDSTPIEGFDPKAMDKLLGLTNYGLHSVLIVTLGYDAENDANRTKPKSRLSMDFLFHDIK